MGPPPHPGSSRLLPPKGLVSAGTSGLHRRWSLGGNSPQLALAKTCDPNVDPWPRWLRLPSSGPRSIPQGVGRCLLPFHLFNRHIYKTSTRHQASTRHWGHSKSPRAHGADSTVRNISFVSWKRAGPSESHVKIHSRLCSFRGQEDMEDGDQECVRDIPDKWMGH